MEAREIIRTIEESVTPRSGRQHKAWEFSLRRRQHKAWGGAQRNPRIKVAKNN